jgi:hypothetical protein
MPQLSGNEPILGLNSESWVVIKNNRVWHVMNLEDLIHENLSHHGCYKWVLKSMEMSILGKVINNHHDD